MLLQMHWFCEIIYKTILYAMQIVFEISWQRKKPVLHRPQGVGQLLCVPQTADTFLAENCLPPRRWKSMT